jgi:hypothetical protein
MLLPDTLVLTRVKFTCTSQSAASGCVAAAFTIRIKIRPPIKGQLRMNVDICLPAEKLGRHGTLCHLHCIAILNSNCSYANNTKRVDAEVYLIAARFNRQDYTE